MRGDGVERKQMGDGREEESVGGVEGDLGVEGAVMWIVLGERQECSCPQTRELRTISQSSQSPVSICPELAGLFVLVVERRGWVFLLFMFKWYTTMIYLYLRAEIDRQLSLTKGSCLLKK